MQAADDVQVGQRRLDHEDVRALVHIQGGLAQRLLAVGRVHLVTAAVAELGRAFGRVPERTVEGRGVFDRIAHYRHHVVRVLVQGSADLAHPAVHHVRGRHHVRSGLGMGQRCLGQQFQGSIVVHLLSSQAAAVAVVGVLAEADVSNHAHVRGPVLQFADGLLNDAVASVGSGAEAVLLFWQAKQDHRTDAERQALFRFPSQLVHRQTEHARHGRYLLAKTLAGQNKEGVDQLLR